MISFEFQVLVRLAEISSTQFNFKFGTCILEYHLHVVEQLNKFNQSTPERLRDFEPFSNCIYMRMSMSARFQIVWFPVSK